MRDAPVIALLGISGAGKSRLAQAIARAMPAVLRLTASGLLRKSLHTTGERLRTAEGNDVLHNQLLLGDALRAEREGQWERPVLLEAHSFIDNDRELVDIPTAVMRELGIAGILHLEAPPAEIVRRRSLDKRRRPHRTSSELERQQIHSRVLAQKYAAELKIPLRSILPNEKDSAVAFITSIAGPI